MGNGRTHARANSSSGVGLRITRSFYISVRTTAKPIRTTFRVFSSFSVCIFCVCVLSTFIYTILIDFPREMRCLMRTFLIFITYLRASETDIFLESLRTETKYLQGRRSRKVSWKMI